MQMPTQFTTARLTLRQPEPADASAIFAAYRYSSIFCNVVSLKNIG
ncbi:hypothetical protein IQ238_28660 [Pleurocapsales cyanobacterium LEGE 06147]|nr:hypothetical protein [Pleurocapsales cyanobacterium LEGE 06147]